MGSFWSTVKDIELMLDVSWRGSRNESFSLKNFAFKIFILNSVKKKKKKKSYFSPKKDKNDLSTC